MNACSATDAHNMLLLAFISRASLTVQPPALDQLQAYRSMINSTMLGIERSTCVLIMQQDNHHTVAPDCILLQDLKK